MTYLVSLSKNKKGSFRDWTRGSCFIFSVITSVIWQHRCIFGSIDVDLEPKFCVVVIVKHCISSNGIMWHLQNSAAPGIRR